MKIWLTDKDILNLECPTKIVMTDGDVVTLHRVNATKFYLYGTEIRTNQVLPDVMADYLGPVLIEPSQYMKLYNLELLSGEGT